TGRERRAAPPVVAVPGGGRAVRRVRLVGGAAGSPRPQPPAGAAAAHQHPRLPRRRHDRPVLLRRLHRDLAGAGVVPAARPGVLAGTHDPHTAVAAALAGAVAVTLLALALAVADLVRTRPGARDRSS